MNVLVFLLELLPVDPGICSAKTPCFYTVYTFPFDINNWCDDRTWQLIYDPASSSANCHVISNSVYESPTIVFSTFDHQVYVGGENEKISGITK